MGLRRALGVEHDLNDPPAIAEVDEGQAAVVAAAGHPAVELDVTADVRGPDVDHWSRSDNRVQVWLQKARRTTTVELTGWVAHLARMAERRVA